MATAPNRGLFAPTMPPGDEPLSHFVFRDVSWADYEAMLRCVGERRIRVNYDRGMLEIISPASAHEDFAYILGVMLGILCEEFEIPFRGCGGPTFRSEKLRRGLEPDGSFYIASFPRVEGKREIDISVDPLPDLAIEVDITHALVDRLGIYASLGIPEIWNFRSRRLRVLLLRGGRYVQSKASPAFPGISLIELTNWALSFTGMNELDWRKAFRAWVHEQPRGGGGRLPRSRPKPR